MQQAHAGSELPNRAKDQPLVWFHCATPARLAALGDLARRLKQAHPGVYVIATLPGALDMSAPADVDHIAILDGDLPGARARSIANGMPSACLWAGGSFLPRLLRRVQLDGTRTFLCDVSHHDIPRRKKRLFPDPDFLALTAFDTVFAPDETARRALDRLGLPQSDVRTATPLERAATPPDCAEEDLSEMKTALVGRPVWLAAALGRDEVDIVLNAHRAALKFQHRLLLILVPADRGDADFVRARLSDHGLRFVDWDSGALPGDLTQVLLGEEDIDLGIWYRVASLSLMGGTFQPHACTPHPMQAAALGAGVLAGPDVTEHSEAWERLIQGGAAAQAQDETQLAELVLECIAPHHAAHMALAGWDIATTGAILIDQLADEISQHLDSQRRPDARA